MLSIIRSHSFTNIALKTAAAACCPARLQAKAFVHAVAAAAAAQRTRRLKHSKQQEQQQNLSNSFRPRASQATVAAQAAQLSTWTAASALSPVQGATPLLTLARQIAEQLGLNGQLRSNPRYRGSTGLETGLKMMFHSLNSYHTGLCGNAEAAQETILEAERRQDPGYLGQYPEMLVHAERHNGSLTTEQAPYYLITDPNCKYILDRIGITAADLRAKSNKRAKYHVDHMLPKSKGGWDHPLNYSIVPASENMRLGGRLGEDKCGLVGEEAFARSFVFHALQLKGGQASTAEMQLQPARMVAQW